MRLDFNLVMMGLATALWVLALPFVFFGAMMAPMIFDAGDTPGAWTFFIFALALPLVCIVAMVGGWIAYRRKHRRLAWAFMVSPVVWAGVGVLATQMMGMK